MLALVIFTAIAVFLLFVFIAGLTSKDRPVVAGNSVLVINLGQQYNEQQLENPLADFSSNDELTVPGLFDVVRLIRHAAKDKKIRGIYLQAGGNPNGFAACDDIRNALDSFRNSGKFILAYGATMSQKSYYVASMADKVYVNPKGYFDWKGFSANLLFLKGTLEKLDIEPQIFYAGKFKSATEPFRTDRMTEENRIQTNAWLGDLYAHFLVKTGEEREIDTATLHQLATDGTIESPADAVNHNLIDGTRYDDEIKDEMKQILGLNKYQKINFVTINRYFKAASFRNYSGERIALIYAQGAIIDGRGDRQFQIGSSDYVRLIRKARLDKNIKAIVFRVNSGGGSALASEMIWRELSLAKQEKPVVVSFGDVAASGGYYISCAADSIFANPQTITGSIGVFGIIPNMQAFFKNKLGVTYDGVKTAPYADAGTVFRPLNEKEKQIIQRSVDEIYATFKERVAEGRSRDEAYIDSIAQGRVWSGTMGIRLGLVDRFGGLQEAVACAARMANLTDYRLREYPEIKSIFDRLFGASDAFIDSDELRKELGDEYYRLFNEIKMVREQTNRVQARLPFSFTLN